MNGCQAHEYAPAKACPFCSPSAEAVEAWLEQVAGPGEAVKVRRRLDGRRVEVAVEVDNGEATAAAVKWCKGGDVARTIELALAAARRNLAGG